MTKKNETPWSNFEQEVENLKKLIRKKEPPTVEEIAFLDKVASTLPDLYQKITDLLNSYHYEMLASIPPFTLKREGRNEMKRRRHALMSVRAHVPGVTIIMEYEKTEVLETDDIEHIIKPKLLVIIKELNTGIRQWRGDTPNSQLKQLNEIIHYSFHFKDEKTSFITKINKAIDRIFFNHHSDIF
ncbi:hypothetical protein [Bacteroidaceae bacterium]|jgi:hypothetical protein